MHCDRRRPRQVYLAGDYNMPADSPHTQALQEATGLQLVGAGGSRAPIAVDETVI